MTITIHRDALKAVSYLSAVKHTHDYLNGVYVEYSPVETRLVATNGHALGIHRSAAENEGRGSFIIPAEAVKTMLGWKIPKSVASTPVTLTPTDTGYRASLLGNDYTFTPVEGQFLDYRHVIPAKCSGVAAQFNPDYLGAFADAARALGGGPVIIAHNGEAAALVSIGSPDFIGLVMPLDPRAYTVIDTPPEWAKGAI